MTHQIKTFEEAAAKGALSFAGQITNLAWSEEEIRRRAAGGTLYLAELAEGCLWFVRTGNRNQLFFCVRPGCYDGIRSFHLPSGKWVSEILYTPALKEKKEAEREILRILGFTKAHQVLFLSRTQQAGDLPGPESGGARFLFRDAVTEDLSSVERLFAACFDPLTDAIPDNGELAEEIGRHAVRLACDEGNGEIAGCAMRQRNKSRLLIRHLAVSPDRQHRGIGTALMLDMLGTLCPGEKCMLWVKEEASAARKLYARLGFAPQGREMEIWTLTA